MYVCNSLSAYVHIEGSLEVKLPAVWTDGKAEVGRVREEKRREEKRREEKRREEKRREEKRREEKKKEDQRRERVRRKKMQVHEKVETSRITVFFQFCGSGGSKSRLAKAAGAEPSGQMRDQKLHAVVARSTFRSQNVQSTPTSEHFWKLRCWKSARRCGAKHISKSKCTKHTNRSEYFWKLRCWKSARRCGAKHISKSKCAKHHMFGPLLEVEMLKKCTPLWREAHFQVKMLKTPHFRDHFWKFKRRVAWQAQGILHLVQKWAKRDGFVAFPKTMAGVGHLKRILKMHFPVAGAVQETCSSEMLGGQGADFLRGVAFWSIRSSGLLRWFCVTGAALRMTWHHFSRGRRNTLDRWSGKIAKRIGTRPSALHSTFHLWRKSRRIASFLMLSTSKIEDVSQTVFRFWRCQVQKLRKSRRIAVFWCCQVPKIEEVSQNSFVFKLADR